MWEELGFYEGFAIMWKAIYDKRGVADEYAALFDCSHPFLILLTVPLFFLSVGPGFWCSSRAVHHIKHLQELIAQFPRVNPSASEASDLDIPKLFRQIRSRYKALCATLGVRAAYGTDSAQSAPQDDEDPVVVPLQPRSGVEKKKVWKVSNPSPSAGENMSF